VSYGPLSHSRHNAGDRSTKVGHGINSLYRLELKRPYCSNEYVFPLEDNVRVRISGMFRLRLAGRSGLPRLEDLNLGSRQPVLYRPTGRFFKPTMLRLCFFSRRRPRFFVSCMQYINCTILHICRRCTL